MAERGEHPAAGAAYAYGFGAMPVDEGRTRFRLWAPDACQVRLELEGQVSMLMGTAADGFHELVCPCAPGTRYCFRIDDDLCVPDPASRRQDGDVHDQSIVVDPSAYAWQTRGWRGLPWSESVIYEIHAGLAGGFRGVLEKLAELKDLGITAVELMPVADFPGARNWGYDGVLPYAPDCAYGGPDDLRLLVDTAHGMGMQVFLDVVYNHFGPDGNYLGKYASGFFRDDVKTPWGPAIDFRKAQVRRFFAENALYWLEEYRMDGLRFDAVHAIRAEGWLPEMARFLRDRIGPDRHVHLILENDDNSAALLGQGFDAQWNDDAHHVLHHILTGETEGYYSDYAEDPTADLAKVLAEGFVYQGQASRWRGGARRGEPSGGLSPLAFVFFLQNHDQTGNRAMGERLAALCADRPGALRAAVALQLLAPHIPMLFMGEECGSRDPFLYFTSFRDEALAAAVRDGRRAEFAGFRAFSDPDERARIPDPNDVRTWEASRPGSLHCADPAAKAWRAYYRGLLRVRKQFLTPHLRGARSVGVRELGRLAVLAAWRLDNGSVLRLYCNLSQEEVLTPSDVSTNEVILFSSAKQADAAMRKGRLPAESTIATIESLASMPARPRRAR